MINMIKIATAECFTHGKIGREIHRIARSYTGNFGLEYIKNIEEYGDFDYSNISLNCSLFIPTIKALESVLQVKSPPKPITLIKGIKVYDEEGDKKVAEIMGNAIKKLTKCDIAIGTTAGIGRGGIAIITNDLTIITTSNIFADLRENNSQCLFERQEDGIKKTIKILLFYLNNDLESIKSLNNIKIIRNKP